MRERREGSPVTAHASGWSKELGSVSVSERLSHVQRHKHVKSPVPDLTGLTAVREKACGHYRRSKPPPTVTTSVVTLCPWLLNAG